MDLGSREDDDDGRRNGGGEIELDYGSVREGTKRDLFDATLFLCATAMGVRHILFTSKALFTPVGQTGRGVGSGCPRDTANQMLSASSANQRASRRLGEVRPTSAPRKDDQSSG